MLSSAACPGIQLRSVMTAADSLTINQLESGIQYNVTIKAVNTLAELMKRTVLSIHLLETSMLVILSFPMQNYLIVYKDS